MSLSSYRYDYAWLSCIPFGKQCISEIMFDYLVVINYNNNNNNNDNNNNKNIITIEVV